MKIASLLAPYLLREKRLDLPRIGSFTYTPEPYTEAEKSKQVAPGAIGFTRKTSDTEAEKLIAYISEQTGKMKPLASSDLSSFTDLALELINTGKPFHLESIGTIVKQSDGELSFLPSLNESDRGREKAIVLESKTKEGGSSQLHNTARQALTQRASKNKSAGLTIMAVVIGIGLAITGGYFFYKNKQQTPIQEAEPIATEPVADSDTSQVITQTAATDTIQIAAANPAPLPTNTYKFVYETTSSRNRAIRRYEQVHELIPSIQMEALNDSSLFKIFIEKQTEDTSRTKLELKAWYWGTAPKQITIE